MALTGIYKITSPSNKVYIGQSRNLLKRVSRYKVFDCPKQRKLYFSLLKYGWVNHCLEVVHELPVDVTQNVLNDYEILYMDLYKDCGIHLLNLKQGGSNGSHGEETKQKLRISTQKTQFKKGNQSFIGKHHTLESKICMSESAKKRGYNLPEGYIHSKATRLKISNANKGKISPNKGKITSYSENAIKVRERKGNPPLRMKRIINTVTGEIYLSVKEAALKVGIKRTTLTSYLRGQNKNPTTLKYYPYA